MRGQSRARKAIREVSLAIRRLPGLRRLATYQDVPPVVVVSPGGVATTMILEYLHTFVRTNDRIDRDGLKHIPAPIDSNSKFVFLYGDVDIVCASLERRGYLRTHGAKLGSPLSVVTFGRLRRRLVRAAIQRQISAFTARREVLSIHYDELWERLDELRVFLEISDMSFVDRFPPRQGRATT